MFKRIVKYFRDLWSEMKKIVWPSKKQSLNNTGIVLVVVVICAVVLTILDLAFNGAVQGLVNLAGIL
ncbi:MAG: preprotein translocase subunit SecE [Oscillospiraceae bacterium]|nr:preprotein translocase subunit SecE [Oscillospiraceae bacterium]